MGKRDLDKNRKGNSSIATLIQPPMPCNHTDSGSVELRWAAPGSEDDR